MDKPAALFLTPESPYPAIGGGALRTASLLTWLAQHYEVDVLAFRQPGAPDPRPAFPPGIARHIHVTQLPHHSKAKLPRLARNLTRALRSRPPLLHRFSGFESAIQAALAGRHYALGVIEHFWCAPYLPLLRPLCARVVLDLHNIESAWHRSMGASASAPERLLHRRFSNAYLARERALLPAFDRILVTSTLDRSRVLAIAPTARLTVFPNAIPYVPLPPRAPHNEIIFTGNLEYQPNIEAVRFFATRVWPLLHRQWPSLTWTIAGKNPHAVQSLIAGSPNISLLGPMPDAVLRIAQAQAAVVPVFSGSGTRIKILEAWAAGTPVVSTTLGAEGLHCVPGRHLLLAESPPAFAQAISQILTDPALAARLSSAGRALYQTGYTWPQAWLALDSDLAAPPQKN